MRGCRRAGIEGQAVTAGRQAAAAVAAVAARPEYGIVILTQQLAAGIRREVDALRQGRERPLIVEIPGPEGPLAGRRSLRELVQGAVGVPVGGKGGA